MHTQYLSLVNNKIGNAGITALATAVGNGALASGAKIFLQDNSVTATGIQVMCDAAKARGLIVYF